MILVIPRSLLKSGSLGSVAQGLAAKLEAGSLGEVEAAYNGNVQRSQGRSIDRVAFNIAEGVGGRRGKRGGIEPFVGGCPGAEDGLACFTVD